MYGGFNNAGGERRWRAGGPYPYTNYHYQWPPGQRPVYPMGMSHLYRRQRPEFYGNYSAADNAWTHGNNMYHRDPSQMPPVPQFPRQQNFHRQPNVPHQAPFNPPHSNQRLQQQAQPLDPQPPPPLSQEQQQAETNREEKGDSDRQSHQESSSISSSSPSPHRDANNNLTSGETNSSSLTLSASSSSAQPQQSSVSSLSLSSSSDGVKPPSSNKSAAASVDTNAKSSGKEVATEEQSSKNRPPSPIPAGSIPLSLAHQPITFIQSSAAASKSKEAAQEGQKQSPSSSGTTVQKSVTLVASESESATSKNGGGISTDTDESTAPVSVLAENVDLQIVASISAQMTELKAELERQKRRHEAAKDEEKHQKTRQELEKELAQAKTREEALKRENQDFATRLAKSEEERNKAVESKAKLQEEFGRQVLENTENLQKQFEKRILEFKAEYVKTVDAAVKKKEKEMLKKVSLMYPTSSSSYSLLSHHSPEPTPLQQQQQQFLLQQGVRGTGGIGIMLGSAIQHQIMQQQLIAQFHQQLGGGGGVPSQATTNNFGVGGIGGVGGGGAALQQQQQQPPFVVEAQPQQPAVQKRRRRNTGGGSPPTTASTGTLQQPKRRRTKQQPPPVQQPGDGGAGCGGSLSNNVLPAEQLQEQQTRFLQNLSIMNLSPPVVGELQQAVYQNQPMQPHPEALLGQHLHQLQQHPGIPTTPVQGHVLVLGQPLQQQKSSNTATNQQRQQYTAAHIFQGHSMEHQQSRIQDQNQQLQIPVQGVGIAVPEYDDTSLSTTPVAEPSLDCPILNALLAQTMNRSVHQPETSASPSSDQQRQHKSIHGGVPGDGVLSGANLVPQQQQQNAPHFDGAADSGAFVNSPTSIVEKSRCSVEETEGTRTTPQSATSEGPGCPEDNNTAPNVSDSVPPPAPLPIGRLVGKPRDELAMLMRMASRILRENLTYDKEEL